MNLIQKMFGSDSDRHLKKMSPLVGEIRSFEKSMSEISDEGLSGKTDEFRERIAKGESLD